MQRIYFNYKTIVLATTKDDVPEYVDRNDVIFMEDYINKNSIETILQQLEKPDVFAAVFIIKDVEVAINRLKDVLTVIEAGGGLVQSNNGNILLINRRNKWDLPKGKLDEGEDLETCATREVKEETGLSEVTIQHPIITTYHIYDMNGEYILKESSWYSMKAKEEALTPQKDEDIEECVWVKKEDLDSYLSNTYPLIKDVVNAELKTSY